MGIQAKQIIIKKKTSFNRDKYIKNICQIIVETYGTDKNTAMNAIQRSGLLNALDFCPDTTSHISDDAWANQIWKCYKKAF